MMIALGALGCATAAPRVAPRAATEGDKRSIATALGPLLYASGLWRGPQDGCALSLGILPVRSINLAVGPHATCKFSLLVTEGALESLPLHELQAALSHEIGHVELGHFAARQKRRSAERDTTRKIEETGTIGGAVATAIPVIGPLLAVGVMGTQAAVEAAAQQQYRTYDRDEELAADRFAVSLVDRVLGHPRGCQAVLALLERLHRASTARLWASWLSTHPSPASRVDTLRGLC